MKTTHTQTPNQNKIYMSNPLQLENTSTHHPTNETYIYPSS